MGAKDLGLLQPRVMVWFESHVRVSSGSGARGVYGEVGEGCGSGGVLGAVLEKDFEGLDSAVHPSSTTIDSKPCYVAHTFIKLSVK